MGQYSRILSALLNLVLVVVFLRCFLIYSFNIVEFCFLVVPSCLWALFPWGYLLLVSHGVAGLVWDTFNVVLLVVVTFIRDTLLRLLMNNNLQCLFSLVVTLLFWEFFVSGE